jgi:hypothetical protein
VSVRGSKALHPQLQADTRIQSKRERRGGLEWSGKPFDAITTDLLRRTATLTSQMLYRIFVGPKEKATLSSRSGCCARLQASLCLALPKAPDALSHPLLLVPGSFPCACRHLARTLFKVHVDQEFSHASYVQQGSLDQTGSLDHASAVTGP